MPPAMWRTTLSVRSVRSTPRRRYWSVTSRVHLPRAGFLVHQFSENVRSQRKSLPPCPVTGSPHEEACLAGRQATAQRRNEPCRQAPLLGLHDAPDLPAQPLMSLGKRRLAA